MLSSLYHPSRWNAPFQSQEPIWWYLKKSIIVIQNTYPRSEVTYAINGLCWIIFICQRHFKLCQVQWWRWQCEFNNNATIIKGLICQKWCPVCWLCYWNIARENSVLLFYLRQWFSYKYILWTKLHYCYCFEYYRTRTLSYILPAPLSITHIGLAW